MLCPLKLTELLYAYVLLGRLTAGIQGSEVPSSKEECPLQDKVLATPLLRDLRAFLGEKAAAAITPAAETAPAVAVMLHKTTQGRY